MHFKIPFASVLTLLVLILLVIAMGFVGAKAKRNLTKLQQNADTEWAITASQYRNREILVPRFVRVLSATPTAGRGDTLAIVKDDEDLKNLGIKPNSIPGDEKEMDQLDDKESLLAADMTRAISPLFRRPATPAGFEVREITAQLFRSDNGIGSARLRFNQSAEIYDQTLDRFPNNIFGKLMGFRHLPYFKTQIASDKSKVAVLPPR